MSYRQPALAAALVLGAAAGCLDAPAPEAPPPAGPFRLAVTYGGAPLAEGRVALIGAGHRVLLAPVGADGVAHFPAVPPGSYQAGVTNYPAAPGMSPPTVRVADPSAGQAVCRVPPRPEVRLPDRFAEPTTSGLVVAVAPGQEGGALPLPRADSDPPVVRAGDAPPVGVAVGQTAPEVAGEDLDGTPFRLSDYRGKVVALLFWGHWCKLCRDRYPEEVALAGRMAGRPFALLGVNTDRSPAVAREHNPRFGTTWRSWWDGPPPGPVAAAWGVEGFPYVVLIDHAGVVRHRALDGAALDRAAEALVAAVPPRP